MNKNTFFRFVFIGAAGVMWAGTVFAQTATGYKPLHRSLFAAVELERNPFWPVGWKPTAAPSTPTAPATETLEVVIHPEDYALTAILLGRPPMAVINNREYAEGDFILIMPGGQKSKVQLEQVLDGKVILRYMNKEYTVILQRKESIKKLAPDQSPTPPEQNSTQPQS